MEFYTFLGKSCNKHGPQPAYLSGMLHDLKIVSSSDLVDMLMKNTEYYMSLCKIGADVDKRKIAENYIDLIMDEIKTRDGFKEIVMDTNLVALTAE